MLTDQEIEAAKTYYEFLQQAVDGMEIPQNDRVRASGGCFSIAQDHHGAIIFLLGKEFYASPLALVRVIFEAYIRGEWLNLCATDKQVRQFLNDKGTDNIQELLDALAKKPAFQSRGLSHIKEKTWRGMNAYTHTGGLHVQRRITFNAIEPGYSREELLEVLQFADFIGSLSILGALSLADGDEMAETVLNRYRERMGEYSKLS